VTAVIPPTAWSVGLPQGFGLPVADLVALGGMADRGGLASVGVGESADVDAAALLGALAQRTSRIRLDAAVFTPAARSPALVVMSAATLGALAPGRVTVGLGAGDATVASWHYRPAGRALVAVEEMIDLLRGNPAAGDTPFRLRGLAAPAVPVYVAAAGPRAAELAGRRADGMLVSCVDPRQASELVAAATAARTGQELGPLEVTAYCWVYAPGDDPRAENVVRKAVVARLASPTYRAMLERHGHGRQAAAAHEHWRDGAVGRAVSAVPDDIVEAVAVSARPERLRERMRAFRDAGCTAVRFVLLPNHNSACAAAELLGAVVQAAAP
jgi:alkanesulfonate monooxygenase SsuD/methylene tetrahydromethanopterin reductase-like flavin-dependent oxidoreductase (luciferase family)